MHRIGIALSAVALLAVAATGDAQTAERVRAHVVLVTLGAFPRELADAIDAGLRAELQVSVARIDESPLPPAAFYRPNKRYRAERLLDHLHTLVPDARPAPRILALTQVDISTTKGRVYDWGVFGLGELGGRAAVISTWRLRRARSAEHFRFRVVTTAIHEVGHTLGLEHCTEPACVMRDAEGSIRTVDTSSGHLGPTCRARVETRSPRLLAP